ncbi:MAG: hypothetical protein AAF633_26960 [Chloroflexota bacterium]
MKQYRLTQKFIGTFVLIYFLIGNIAWIGWGTEIFPFYSWDLFSFVPNQVADYGLLILSVDGQPVDSPLYFEEAEAYLINPNSIEAQRLIQEMGRALEQNRLADLDRFKGQLESLFFGRYDQMTYQIMRRTYFPVKRFNEGIFESEREIGALTYQR